GHYKIDTIVAILDANGLQGDGAVQEQMDHFPVLEKVRAFKWNAIEIDGHNIAQIRNALENAKNIQAKPTFIFARTVKGKGVSFMENSVYWHGSVGITDEQLAIALKDLGA
ncbi:MAG: transketolase, partial [Candidatus Omnitrophota bacterium]